MSFRWAVTDSEFRLMLGALLNWQGYPLGDKSKHPPASMDADINRLRRELLSVRDAARANEQSAFIDMTTDDIQMVAEALSVVIDDMTKSSYEWGESEFATVVGVPLSECVRFLARLRAAWSSDRDQPPR